MRKFAGLFLFMIVPICVSAQNYTGTYFRSSKDGQIKITQSRKSSLKFKMNVVGKHYGFCTGELTGEAKFAAQNIFEYNGNFKKQNSQGCRLTFVFSGKSLTIRETDCGYFHGAACNFEGTYQKH